MTTDEQAQRAREMLSDGNAFPMYDPNDDSRITGQLLVLPQGGDVELAAYLSDPDDMSDHPRIDYSAPAMRFRAY